MADLPWFPTHAADEDIQTRHLTCEQVGALERIKRYMWLQPDCGIASDMATLRLVTGLPPRGLQQKLAPVLNMLTLLDTGRYTIPRLNERRMAALIKRAQCQDAGRRGGRRSATRKVDFDKPLLSPPSRQIPNRNNGGGQANATPNADIYKREDNREGSEPVDNLKASSPPDLPHWSVGSPPKPLGEGLAEALDRLRQNLKEGEVTTSDNTYTGKGGSKRD
jgi:hypothetical protein